VATPILAPTFPPEGPWAAYVYVVIWLPLLLRLLLLARPARRVVAKLAPHAGWALKQLMELPVRGLRLLIFNEVLAFSLPLIVVFVYRQLADPIGWRYWSDGPWYAHLLLFVLASVWVFLDLLRIRRVRRVLVAVERQDVERLRKVADLGLGARRWLRRFGGKEPVEESTKQEPSNGLKVLKRAGGIALLSRKFTPQGLAAAVAWSAAEELAKRGAAHLSDRIDDHIQASVDVMIRRNAKTSLMLAARDLAMGLVPLLLLALLPWLF
jgi:hypothetical protein